MSLYKGNNLISGTMPNSANQSLSNLNSAGQDIIDGKVSKAGDTMTGALNITLGGDNTNNLIIKNNSIERFVTPSVQNQTRIQFVDKNNEDIGSIYYQQRTDGSSRLSQVLRNNSGSDAYSYIGINSLGSPTCTFPNTTCVDGQWVYKNTSLGSSVKWNTSSHKDAKNYSLSSYLPNDGQKYEVLIRANGTTTSTSGKFISVGITSDIITAQVYVCRCRTRSSSSVNCSGNIIIPIGTERKIYVAGAGSEASADGTYDIACMGYRRIGTNS